MEVEKLIQNEKEIALANNLQAAGNALLSSPPPTSQQLLPLLSELEQCLTETTQSPPKCVQSATNLAINALTSKELFQNEDEHVKVSVALCGTEIMRITAPNGPCDDERMKDLFALIVSAFDNISDISSSSYLRRISILKYFMRVRLWNVMVDLKCDSSILQMFKHFLANIRENHPEYVFMHMGIIMIKILQEIDEIPLELLSTLLFCVRKRNKNVLPIARKLSERVMENSYLKLIPYMNQAVKYTGYPLKGYGKIVAVLCEQQSLLPEEDNHHEVVASQASTPGNSPALQNKDDSSVLQWIGKKRRIFGRIKTHGMQEQLSAKTSLPPNEDEHSVGNLTGSLSGVECLEEHRSCEGDLEKKQKVEEHKSIEESEEEDKSKCASSWNYLVDGLENSTKSSCL